MSLLETTTAAPILSRSQIKDPVILFVGADPEFVARIQRDPFARVLRPVFAPTANDARAMVADRLQPISAILLAHPEEDLIAIVRATHLERLGTPIYLLQALGTSPLPNPLLLGIHGEIDPAVTGAELSRLVSPMIEGFHPSEFLKVARTNAELFGAEKGDDAEFIPTHVRTLLACGRTAFDLFVRLPSGRYVKLLHAGDAFSPERLAQYLRRGVTHFHVRAEARHAFLEQCDSWVAQRLAEKQLSRPAKTQAVARVGELTMELLRDAGVSDRAIEHARRFSLRVENLLEQLELERSMEIQEFIQDAVEYEHGVATAMVVSLLFRPFSLDSEKLQNTIGLAGLLHDIGKLELPAHLREREDDAGLGEQDRKLFQTHPIRGGQMLRKLQNIDPVIVHAVEQHHERRDGKGFPKKVGADRMGLFGQLVGLADEVVHLASTHKGKKGRIDLVAEIEWKCGNGFSTRVMEALKKALSY